MAPTNNKMLTGARGSSARLDTSASSSTAQSVPPVVPEEKPLKNEIPEFTPTEVLDEVMSGDNTLNIVGFIDVVLGSEIVGKKRKLSLFKFILNNNDGTKILALLWEDQIPLYERSIIYHEVLELQNVKALPLDPIYNPRKEGYANFDLSIQRNTKLIFHGVLNAASIVTPVIENVLIKYAAAYEEGPCVVEGYVSTDFSRVTTGSGSCSYATGAISDGQYKLRVQVADFMQTTDTTTLGTNVRITGRLKKDRLVFILQRLKKRVSKSSYGWQMTHYLTSECRLDSKRRLLDSSRHLQELRRH